MILKRMPFAIALALAGPVHGAATYFESFVPVAPTAPIHPSGSAARLSAAHRAVEPGDQRSGRLYGHGGRCHGHRPPTHHLPETAGRSRADNGGG